MTAAPERNPWADIIGPCYTAGSIARTLGWTAGAVTRAASSLELLELDPVDGPVLYPVFQVWDGAPVKGLGQVLRVLSTGTHSRWTWAQWLNTRLPDGEGGEEPSAIEMLRDGRLDEVLRDAQHDAWSWSS